MELSEEQTKELAKKLESLSLSPAEFVEVVTHLLKRLKTAESRATLTAVEIDCISALLKIACNYPTLSKEIRESNQRLILAEQELRRSGTPATKLRAALRVFGLYSENLDQRDTNQMVELYRRLLTAAPDDLDQDRYSALIVFSEKTYVLAWKDENDKRERVIDLLREKFFQNSVDRNSVIKRLERAGVKNLPWRTHLDRTERILPSPLDSSSTI